jgi:hypothetical protein
MDQDQTPYSTAEELQIDDAKIALESIRERNRSFYSDRRGTGALKDLQQTFPHPWLYIAELLQNAVDAHATRIAVTICDDSSLLLEHDGVSFSLKDVEALCAKGLSAKGANTVGFMGVGFKSVFRSFELVQVSSGPWRFALNVAVRKGAKYGDQQRDWLGAVLPYWDACISPPSPDMKCRFNLSNRLSGLPRPSEDLERVLGASETLLALLAWQGVKELKWNGKSWALQHVESPLGGDEDARVLLQSVDSKEARPRRWILFSKSYQPSRAAIARFLEHRQLAPAPEDELTVYQEASQRRKVAVFCELDEAGCPITLNRGSAFALLPTDVTFPIGLHVQADWLLVVTRREMMQIEGNEWHGEILAQFPHLIRAYLEWLVTLQRTGWNRGYEALPGSSGGDGPFDEWFSSTQFLDSLRAELESLPFLPQPSDKPGVPLFLAPKDSRVLPKPLARDLEGSDCHSELLFGAGVISSQLLGVRARQCLEKLNLLQELSASDLATHWQAGIVRNWLALFPKTDRDTRLLRVLKALAELDEQEEWKNAELICLPTVADTWTHRKAITRYPADWNVLGQEDEIRNTLESFIGEPERTLPWNFERVLRQTRLPAGSYFEAVPPPKFEEIANKWWDSMPEVPSEADVALIVRFSAWVLKKQPQRRSLVKRVLCMDQEGRTKLETNGSTVLAEPYAGSFRRIFFPLHPTIVSGYEIQGAAASRTEWRAFFESLEPPPAGKFSLTLTATMMFRSQLMKYLPEGYTLPALRSSWMTTERQGFEVQSGYFTVVDAALPSVLNDLLKSTVTRDQSSATSQWLSESPAQLSDNATVKILYIPYSSSWVDSRFLPKSAEWVALLRDTAWIYAKTGYGPFKPCDLLPMEDPVRPNAPVAELAKDLIGVLQGCGIEFGDALPNAPATERLRVQGPDATPEQLLEFLGGAIAEASADPVKQELLKHVLLQRELFPVPGGSTIDGAMRVAHGRVVRSERGRSLLGNWLISIDSFSKDSGERKVLELVDAFLPVPETASFTQTVDFLLWVWSKGPDAELVRRLLPRAYAYAKEDIENDRRFNERWKAVLPNARVFVQRKRRWVSILGANNLFFDDLNNGALKNALPSIDLATPGHLGEDSSDQLGTAKLLGIKLLSSRFRVSVEREGAQPVPDLWQVNFGAIQDWLRRQLQTEEEGDWGGETPTENLKLSQYRTLRTVVHDSDMPVQTRQVMAAALRDGTIAVSGTPEQFAEELCRILFTKWGLRLRRDLVELLPNVAIQLTRIDDESPMFYSETTLLTQWRPSEDNQPVEPVVPLTSTVEEVPKAIGRSTDTTENVSQPRELGPEETVLKSEIPDEIAPGGSYTPDTREARTRALIEKRAEIDRKIREALALDVSPLEAEEQKPKAGEFRTDDPYRQAALKFESENGRHARAKSATQSGHDIDSYTHPDGHPDRKLVRRIEVKGRSTPWDFDEIVEMSDRQFKDALNVSVRDGEQIDADFDYWLYVVERQEDGHLNVLPIRNAAKKAAWFGLKGGSWRHEAEPKSAGFPTSQEGETETNS